MQLDLIRSDAIHVLLTYVYVCVCLVWNVHFYISYTYIYNTPHPIVPHTLGWSDVVACYIKTQNKSVAPKIPPVTHIQNSLSLSLFISISHSLIRGVIIVGVIINLSTCCALSLSLSLFCAPIYHFVKIDWQLYLQLSFTRCVSLVSLVVFSYICSSYVLTRLNYSLTTYPTRIV